MSSIDYKIVDSISTIKREAWEAVFGDIPEGYAFYKTVAESQLKEFSFYFVLLYQNGRLVLIAPVFITDFYADSVLEKGVAGIITSVRGLIPRFLVLKTLFCGSPFGEHGIIGIHRDAEDLPRLLSELVRVVNAFCKEKDISLIIFKDFPPEAASFLDTLQPQGFFKTDSFPSAVVDLPFTSFDEYLGSLSHATRKSLRRKLKKARASGEITTSVAGSIDTICDDIYRLYENTYTAGATKFEKLTREFFIKIAENLGPNCIYFLYYVNGKLSAFNLCFKHGDLLIDKFVGFDYDIAHQHNLYFISWCYNIEWCLQHSLRFYQVGQTDYEPKTHLGARLVPLYAYVRHTNGMVNFLLKLLSRFLNV